jgi:hypothetical protein
LTEVGPQRWLGEDLTLMLSHFGVQNGHIKKALNEEAICSAVFPPDAGASSSA